MSIVVSRLFDTYEQASQAVADLEAGGVPHSNISIVANNADSRYNESAPQSTVDAAPETGAGTGATLGAVLGGGAGLLAGLGMLAIPGVGPVVAAGWLVSTLVGAGVGAASGGLLGSLVGAGVSEADAHVYSEGVRRGGALVTVRADDSQASFVDAALAKYSPVDASVRGEEYRAGGWSRFDETAPAYVAGAPPVLGTKTTTITGL